jgi:chemotaxis protein histidine kinase CheA
LNLRAFTSADTVIIEIEDDGRGIDESAVRARLKPGTGAPRRNLDEAGLLNIPATPGFYAQHGRLAEWTRHRDGRGETLGR